VQLNVIGFKHPSRMTPVFSVLHEGADGGGAFMPAPGDRHFRRDRLALERPIGDVGQRHAARERVRHDGHVAAKRHAGEHCRERAGTWTLIQRKTAAPRDFKCAEVLLRQGETLVAQLGGREARERRERIVGRQGENEGVAIDGRGLNALGPGDGRADVGDIDGAIVEQGRDAIHRHLVDLDGNPATLRAKPAHGVLQHAGVRRRRHVANLHPAEFTAFGPLRTLDAA